MKNYIAITDIMEIRDNEILTSGMHWINPDKIVHLQARSNKAFMDYVIITLSNGEILRTEGTVNDILDALGICEIRITKQWDDLEEDDEI